MKKIIKTAVLAAVAVCLSAFLLSGCQNNADVMATVNGVDITRSDYETRLKSHEIMTEIITEDINNSDIGSEEKTAKIKELKEKYPTDQDAILDSMIETAYIDSKYASITHEQAKSEIEKQLENLDSYADEYPEAAVNGKITDEYIKRMGLTKEEYTDIAADSYISYVNKQKAKEEFAKKKDISDDTLDKEFESYLKQEISKTLIVRYK